MSTHLVSAESAKEIINKQLQLESENRSMAYLIWHYDQKEGDRNGWREYIEYPAVAYCKDKEDLRNITEIAVERPPEDTYDFVNREIRTRLIADGKNLMAQWDTLSAERLLEALLLSRRINT